MDKDYLILNGVQQAAHPATGTMTTMTWSPMAL